MGEFDNLLWSWLLTHSHPHNWVIINIVVCLVPLTLLFRPPYQLSQSHCQHTSTTHMDSLEPSSFYGIRNSGGKWQMDDAILLLREGTWKGLTFFRCPSWWFSCDVYRFNICLCIGPSHLVTGASNVGLSRSLPVGKNRIGFIVARSRQIFKYVNLAVFYETQSLTQLILIDLFEFIML